MISVIIPAFNAEKTIGISIENVQMQTYSNLELIIVDDGSIDGTEKICKNYVQLDDRIQYLKKDNGGVSSARNMGVQFAKGEYIVFCDSDDYLEVTALKVLIESALASSADFIIPRNRGVYYLPNGQFDKYVMDEDDFEMIVNHPIKQDEFEKLRRSSSIYSTCGRMYRREFLVNNRIRFNERIKVLEDFCFNLKCLQNAKCISHISYVAYNYTVYGIEEYKFRRSYRNYIVSLPVVYSELQKFLDCHEMRLETTQIDLLMGYWIFALDNILVSEDGTRQKIASIKQVLAEVEKENLYEGCTIEYLDTHFKVLFNSKKAFLFLVVYKLKKLKNILRKKF